MSITAIWLLILVVTLLIAIMSGMPVMLAISGIPVIIGVIAAFFGHFDLSFFGAFPQRVFGIMNNSLLIAIPLFVMMGILLERSKVAERMLLIMASFFGGDRAGLAYSVLIVSTLIAASTGIIGATIVMLGMISLPALLKAGVSVRLSSGLICASGTLGQIIPPSIVLILLGDQISNAYIEAQQNIGNFAPDPVSVGDLFAGAILPGLLLVLLYAFYVFIHNRFIEPEPRVTNHPISGAKQENTAIQQSISIQEICTAFMPPILLIIAVLGSILFGVATPTEAAAVGVAGTLLIAAANSVNAVNWLKKLILLGAIAAFSLSLLISYDISKIDLSSGSLVLDYGSVAAIGLSLILLSALVFSSHRLVKDNILRDAISQSVSVSGMVFAIIIAASMLSLVFRGFEGDEMVAHLLSQIPGDKWGALIAVMLVVFLLGFILEFVEILFIVIPIVGPVILAMDFNPIWFAIMIAINLQTSFLTPPFGFALFYFRSVAPKSISTIDIYKSVIPFVFIQIITMGVLVVFPELVTWLPTWIFS
ncbi:MAG: TRAP transporter large permease subunit [Oceanospirillaceae bacterium]